MFLQRFIYNIARLFQSQGTYISILAYGKKPHLVTKWQTFTSAQALQVSIVLFHFEIPLASNKTLTRLKFLLFGGKKSHLITKWLTFTSVQALQVITVLCEIADK